MAPGKPNLATFRDREIVVAVCGGIAVYKVADVVSKLVQAGAGVSACMTENAQEFVAPLTFQALTHRPVHVSMWQDQGPSALDHLSIAERASVILVAPATANILGKVANGICDDLTSTLICAAACPVLFAPAMNTRMWQNPITQENVDRLRRHGYHFVGPEEGFLAERTIGPGRLAEPSVIIEALAGVLARPSSSVQPATP